MSLLRRRHHLIGVRAEDALHHLAAIGVLRLHRDSAVALHDGFGADVEAKLGLARLLIGAMALKALLREHGADIAIEIHHGGDGAILEHVAVRVLLGAQEAGHHEQAHSGGPTC